MTDTFLVTGALGCIGAWTLKHLLAQGAKVISMDLHERGHRLDLVMSAEEQAAIDYEIADISQPDSVFGVFERHSITHIIHLAALQVPFCKADPIKGAQVNVVGTVNLFEAARRAKIQHLAYASSIAVYGAPDEYDEVVTSDAAMRPRTLYGVYKQADEGIARLYAQDFGVHSIALRPYTVYGVGRDQGLTSDPTKAMLAAAQGKPFHINFGGTLQLQWASDVAQSFIAAARTSLEGAHAWNMGGQAVTIPQIIGMIQALKPEAQISYNDAPLPFPSAFDDSELKAHLPHYETPLQEGIAQTLAHFEACLADGRLLRD
jgi:UDP-glucuronate 4-epimerase